MKPRVIGLRAALVAAILSVGLVAGTGFSLAFAAGPSPTVNLNAHLSPAPGVSTKANGQATFQIDASAQTIAYTLRVSNLENAFMAHIHLSPTGDILLWLYPNPATVSSGDEAACLAVISGGPASACPGYKAGSFSGVLAQGTITPADLSGSTTCAGCLGVTFAQLVSDIEAGQTYVNVHTTQNPGGEIAGTIQAHQPYHPQPPTQLQASLAGSYPGISIAGIPSGGAPWIVSGQAQLSPKGDLKVNIHNLVIYGTGSAHDGTTGPVTQVLASVLCATSSGTSVTSTGAVPLSAAGNAKINQNIAIPSTCFAPQILIRIAATAAGPVTDGAWIAATGMIAS